MGPLSKSRRAPSGTFRFGVACAGLALAALLLLPPGARAGMFTVTNTDDMGTGSLRQALIDAEAAADADVVDATGVSGTIDLQTTLPILTHDVEIRGPGAALLTVRRADGVSPFRIFRGISLTWEISGLTIANGQNTNSLAGGGGIASSQATLTVRNSVIKENANTATGNGQDGGGIVNDSASTALASTMTIVDSTVSGNTAAGDGAGIFNSVFSTLTLRNSTVSGNVSQGGTGCVGGGGIHNEGFLTVANSTVTGNVAAPNSSIGGILSCTTSTGSNTIVDSTIAGNSASPGRPVNLGVSGPGPNSMTLQGTIVGGPASDGPNCLVVAPATFTSDGYNLASDASCNLTGTADQPSTNPLLGSLADNGGPTQTMALAPNSPAVDGGVTAGLTSDQRGLNRPIDFGAIANAVGGDGSDIGAFELQALPSSDFSFGKVSRQKKKGTATLTVIVPGPGALELAGTKRVKGQSARAGAAGEVKLLIKPMRSAKRKLRRTGKARVNAAVTYTPDAGQPLARSRTVKLIER